MVFLAIMLGKGKTESKKSLCHRCFFKLNYPHQPHSLKIYPNFTQYCSNRYYVQNEVMFWQPFLPCTTPYLPVSRSDFA